MDAAREWFTRFLLSDVVTYVGEVIILFLVLLVCGTVLPVLFEIIRERRHKEKDEKETAEDDEQRVKRNKRL